MLFFLYITPVSPQPQKRVLMFLRLTILTLFAFLGLWSHPLLANLVMPLDDIQYLVESLSNKAMTEYDARQSVEWIASKTSNLSFGYSKKIYWVRFPLSSERNGAGNKIIRISYPILDSLTAYIYRDGKLAKTYK